MRFFLNIHLSVNGFIDKDLIFIYKNKLSVCAYAIKKIHVHVSELNNTSDATRKICMCNYKNKI